MTDKEHLKDVKELINKYENCYDKDTALKYAVDLMRNHARYFIEQAERVQELEETVEDYKTVNKELHQRGRKVRKQNKRYREALEFYANRNNYKLEHFDPSLNDYMSTVDYDEGQKARQTIGGEQ